MLARYLAHLAALPTPMLTEDQSITIVTLLCGAFVAIVLMAVYQTVAHRYQNHAHAHAHDRAMGKADVCAYLACLQLAVVVMIFITAITR